MKLGAITLVLLVSCVPAGSETDPRGSAAFMTEPSAATRGEAFMSDDGWTLHIEQLAFITIVTATSPGYEEPAEERFLWNAREPTQLIVRAVPTGTATLFTAMQGAGRRFDGNGVEVSPYLNLGVPTDVDLRLRVMDEPPDPTLLAVLRGEKDGKSVHVEALIPTITRRPMDPGARTIDVSVIANEVTFAHLEVHAETLFTTFQPYADGQVTPSRPLIAETLFTLKP